MGKPGGCAKLAVTRGRGLLGKAAVGGVLFSLCMTCFPWIARGLDREEFFSYRPYADVLGAYVDDRGLVDYRGLKADPRTFEQFVTSLGRLDVSWYDQASPRDRIAFWINAYNALTLKAVVDHYPIKASILGSLRFPKNSIRQIPGVWNRLTFRVMGTEVTLDGIEHDTLRKRFDEPRIHMALVCAALGCPPLRNQPYEGAQLDAQLDDQTRRFLSRAEKFRIDRNTATVYLSPIFKWFGSDFVKTYEPRTPFPNQGKVESAVLAFVGKYLPPIERIFLEQGEYSITYLGYDWSLNEKK